MILRPMLAPNDDYEIQKTFYAFPCLASPKIDGLRCYKYQGHALTRSGKIQPNPWVRELLEPLPNGLDGELTVGSNFRTSTSELRRTWGKPNFTYWVFDYVKDGLHKPVLERIQDYTVLDLPDWCIKVPQIMVYDMQELLELEELWLAEGFEGAMLRKPSSHYKCNRSTLKEGILLKMKRYQDAEAEIIGFFEQEENQNESFTNELGTSSRSSHQENKVGKGTLGGLVVRDLKTNQEFRLGTGQGWTVEWRSTIWNNQDQYLGRVLTYKHLPHGNYDAPRNASMKGFREEWDTER